MMMKNKRVIPRKLYVVTKPLFDSENVLKTHLVGVLTEIEKEKCSFEYKLGGEFRKHFLKIPEFPDIGITYIGSRVTEFVRNYVPERTDKYAALAVHSAGLSEYNEWAMLVFYGAVSDTTQEFQLRETLPEGTVTYE